MTGSSAQVRGRSNLYYWFNGNFPGGVKGQDTCTGDGGSPLVCPIPGQSEYFYQAGIVVGGIGCGDKDVPAFYVDVFKYMPWIRSNADAHGIEL